MDGPVVIELAGEPRGKGRPRFAKATGRAFTPAATRAYEGALRFAAQEAMAGRAPLDGPLRVDVLASIPIPASMTKRDRALVAAGQLFPTKKPDIDNILKNLDALNQVVFVDDKQVVDGHIVKRFGERPGLRITVSRMGA